MRTKHKDLTREQKDKRNISLQKWRDKNPERVEIYNARTRERRKAQGNSIQKEWRKNNPEKMAQYNDTLQQKRAYEKAKQQHEQQAKQQADDAFINHLLGSIMTGKKNLIDNITQKAITINIDIILYNKLDELVAKTKKKKTFHIKKALMEYLSKEDDIQIAEKRLIDIKAGKNKLITHDELKERLDK